MMAENEMAYAFYRRVPGYGTGGQYEIKGPRTYYSRSGKSVMTGDPYSAATMAGMTWEEWRTKRFIPAY